MPPMGIVNILPFFKLNQLKALQHFYFPIVTWCQCMNRDGKHCSVVLSPSCGHKYPGTVAGRPMDLVKIHEEHIRKAGPFLVCTPLGWGNRRNTEACE